jgi:hypothetical protein
MFGQLPHQFRRFFTVIACYNSRSCPGDLSQSMISPNVTILSIKDPFPYLEHVLTSSRKLGKRSSH